MAKMLIHLATGPENPTRAALALLVARTAAEEGNEVQTFLAGDAVQLVRPATAEAAHGIGTGNVSEHFSALSEAGIPAFLSRMSSKARGIEAGTAEIEVELSPPTKLVELSLWADVTFTY